MWNHIPRNVPFKLVSVLKGRCLFADNAGATQDSSSFSKAKFSPWFGEATSRSLFAGILTLLFFSGLNLGPFILLATKLVSKFYSRTFFWVHKTAEQNFHRFEDWGGGGVKKRAGGGDDKENVNFK